MAPASVPAIHSIFGDDTARARRSDPETSHLAGDSNRVSTSIAAVLDTLTQHGSMTDERLVAMMASLGHPYTPQRIRTARAALVKTGKVHSTGRHGQTVSGHRARVWAVTGWAPTFTPELFTEEATE